MQRRSFWLSFAFALDGIAYAVRTQRNMRVHFVTALLVLVTAAMIGVSLIEWLLLVLFIVQVIFAELFNTAMEVLVDMVSPEWREEAKVIKNVAAGAVLLCSMSAILVGLWIFVPKLRSIFAG